jgi:hypothetical protein
MEHVGESQADADWCGEEGLPAALATEIEEGLGWMYPWELKPGVATPILHPELPAIHRTRLRLIEDAVRTCLRAAGPHATVVDLACNEGWFAHRMIEWGASRVLGVDIRPRVIRRATLLRDHFGIGAERLELRCADVFDVRPSEVGTFDVVLCLGLVYHLEDPIGAIRRAAALASGLCVIESQLTRQAEAIVHGWGATGEYENAPASWAARMEADQESNMLASAGGVVSLIPNRAALTQAVTAAGLVEVEFPEPSPGDNMQYRQGDRAVLLAWTRDRAARARS